MKKSALLVMAAAVVALLACDNLAVVELEPGVTYVAPDFVDNGDGTVTDRSSNGIMWKKCPYDESGTDCLTGTYSAVSWNTANAFCENMSFAGHDDWRIPTLDEVKTLEDPSTASWFKDYSSGTKRSEAYWWTSTRDVGIYVYYITLSTGSFAKTVSLDGDPVKCHVICCRAIAP